MKNKHVAAILAFVFGWAGAHKFYLRDPGSGIFYLMLTFVTSSMRFPIATILGFIDGLRLLMMTPEDFDRKYNVRHYKQKLPKSRRHKPGANREYYEVKKQKKNRPTPVAIRKNPFKKSGIKKYKNYDIEEAIKDFHRAIKISPKDISLYFNLACAYSLLEDKDEAFSYLQKAVKMGFKDFERIQTHDDLAFVRIQPEYENFKESGFTNIPVPSQHKKTNVSTEKPAVNDILLAQLNRLVELRKKGVLTEKEFAVERKKIFASG